MKNMVIFMKNSAYLRKQKLNIIKLSLSTLINYKNSKYNKYVKKLYKWILFKLRVFIKSKIISRIMPKIAKIFTLSSKIQIRFSF